MKLTIAVIDDGISKETISDLEFKLVCKNGILREDSSEISFQSHGSICAAIIKKYAPQAKIGSIRILSEDGRGEPEDLIAALNLCIDLKIKLINLSIGSTQACDIPLMYETVNRVAENGGIIIAACKTLHNISFPASFMNVIGVRAGEALSGSQYIMNREPNGGIEFSANASHDVIVSSATEAFSVSEFNSYAAPVISAVVFNLLFQDKCGDSLSEIRAELINGAGPDILDSELNCNALVENVPVVVFVGNQYRAIIRKVAGKFLDDNYLPLLFSQFTEDCSAECLFLDDLDALKNRCHNMADFYSADLILATIGEDDVNDLEADVVIIDEWKREIPGTVFLYSDGKNIDELYNQLIAVLES